MVRRISKSTVIEILNMRDVMVKNGIFAKYVYVFLFILLFSMISRNKNFFTIITFLGALMGLITLISNWRYYFFQLKENRFLYIGIGILIPIIIASIDSPVFSKSFAVFTKMFQYFLMGSLAIVMLSRYEAFSKLKWLVVIGLTFISLDAIAQWLTDYHIYGYDPVEGNRVLGVFGKDRYHLSYFLGTFAPVLLFAVYSFIDERKSIFRIIVAFFLLAVLIVGVVIGGARAGMVSLLVSIILFVSYLFVNGHIRYKGRFLLGLLIVIAIALAITSQSEIVQDRFMRSISAFGTDQFLQTFSSGRLNVWYVGFNEIPNHWLNGMGPRAFDTYYQMYPEDYKIYPVIWQPHLHGLEVMIETGIIGFIPYIVICCYLFYRIFTAKAGNMWLMMAFVAIMPINSHLGLYQDYFWYPVFWVPIMLGLAQAYHANSLIKDSHAKIIVK